MIIVYNIVLVNKYNGKLNDNSMEITKEKYCGVCCYNSIGRL